MVPVVYAHSLAPHLEKLPHTAPRDQGRGTQGTGGERGGQRQWEGRATAGAGAGREAGGSQSQRENRGGGAGDAQVEEALLALHVIQGCCLVDSQSRTLALRTSLCQVWVC